MKKIVTLSSAIALALTVSTTIAAPNMGNKLVEKFDVNQDGEITKAEVLQVHGERFATADADGDGFLTSDEMAVAREQRRQERMEARFAELDTNENGSLSLEEFQAGMPSARYREERKEAHFAEWDTNGDGALSLEEVQAGMPSAQHRGRRGGDPENRLARLDENDDGQLSDAEMSTHLLQMFERLDTDGDDVISEEEMNQKPAFGNRGSQCDGNGNKSQRGGYQGGSNGNKSQCGGRW